MLLAWTSQSSWGDLDAVNLHWRRDLRAAVQASQADCTFKRCRFFPHLCYLHGIRDAPQARTSSSPTTRCCSET